MDELEFYVSSTVFQSYRDAGRVNMKDCTMKCRLGSERISHLAGFEPATPWSEVGSANRSPRRRVLQEKYFFFFFFFVLLILKDDLSRMQQIFSL